MAATVKVKVAEGWTVYDGEQQRSGGETVEVDSALAEAWLAAGWVEKVKAPTRREATAAK